MGQNLKGNGHVQQNVSRIENKLSVDLEMAARHTRIPTLVLRQIWSKATDLFMSNKVTVAPGCPNSARMVASKSKQKPHFVSLSEDGPYQCDEACPNFRHHFICSHCVAAAERNGGLSCFLESYGRIAKTRKGQQSISPNFTRLSMTNLPHRATARNGIKPPANHSLAANGAQLSRNHPSSEPFLVKLLNGRIKICAGCKGPHLKNTNNHVLSPPYDICIYYKETQAFINPQTGLESSKLGNAYYHVNLTCIQRKHPNFF